MNYLLTGRQMIEADRHTIEHIGIPSMVLMERAALHVADALERIVSQMQSVLVVCGTGNNGGDGYAVARLLHLRGYDVSIYFVGDEHRRSAENRLQKQIAEYYQIPVKQNLCDEEYSVIIDAIFGTGLNRDLPSTYGEVLEQLNQMAGFKVAIDIPSGLSSDTGMVMGYAFRADLTIALGFFKRGHAMISGNPNIGKVILADIGIGTESLPQNETFTYSYNETDFKERFPIRQEQSHKGSYGKVLLIVGSKGMAGAALLCARAAYMTGAGLVHIYTHEENRTIIQESLPEAILTTYDAYDEEGLKELLCWADVVGIGCGLGQSEVSKEIVECVLKHNNKPCVMDADALNILAVKMELLKQHVGHLVLTPHLKEMARMLSLDVQQVAAEKIDVLLRVAKDYQVTCVLKDARTLVYKDGQHIYLNMTGNSAMAKAGSGDVLTGIITGILAQCSNTYESACLGVWLHGMCGDSAAEKKGKYSVLAGDLIDSIGDILKQI